MDTYRSTFSIKKLWIILATSMIVMFAVLLLLGREIYQQVPPLPEQVVTSDGKQVFTREAIQRGQSVWQSLGGMQQGSIWGHGSYLAPDWSADWLRREAEALLAIKYEKTAAVQSTVTKQQLSALAEISMRNELRLNTYKEDKITISAQRSLAVEQVAAHYKSLFQGKTEVDQKLRRDYAFPLRTTISDDDAHALSAFFFWSAWAAVTNRPDDDISYTSNWPYDPLVGNTPPPSLFMWSFISVLLLLGGIGALVWYYVRQYDVWRMDMEPEEGFAHEDRLATAKVTPSMRATAKYFWAVTALFGLQVLLGILTAHYQVEGQGFYGLPWVDYLPYAVSRTWHTQLAVLWIATSWLATGLYVAPLLSGYEPKLQRFGVNFLFISLLVIVIGSFLGEWTAIHGFFDSSTKNFWFGHQGYEYVDLGRFWQIYLLVGLLLWVVLMLRALWPLMKQRTSGFSLVFLVILSTVSIGLLYGAGLMWGEHTHISVMEYWRWWVVHLWVEGVFEVFATAIIATLFVKMGLLRISVATTSVLFATIIFLCGGVLGTFHHLYFSGTPVSVMAVGATFSALEVVPLMVVGFEAYNHAKVEKKVMWENAYHWPFMFFSAVLVWNLVGAGLFGFLINPPIALYFMQGLNTTANHGHAALFGVYGFLGLGLMLYCMRGLTDIRQWNNRLLKLAFWSLNLGLAMMTFLSLLPQGLWQTYYSIKEYYAFARSAEFMHSTVMETLVWIRVPGDVVFSIGVIAFALFVWQAFRGRQALRTEVNVVDAR